MFRYVKLSGIILLFVLFLSTPVFSQTQTEQLVITTYYPSPYGSYRQLQVTDSGAVASRTALGVSQGNTGGGTSYAISATNPAASGGTNVGGSFFASGGTTNIGLIANGSQTGLLVSGGVLTVTGLANGNLTSVSGTITSSSDERLKDIKGYFTRGIESLQGIQPIIYKWNKKSGLETEHEFVGFSAQNVRKTIPESIGVGKDGFLSLNDRVIMAALVNAAKEQQAEIKELKKEIQLLKKK